MNNNKRIIANVGRSVKTLLFVAVMAMASSCDDFLTIFPTDRIVFEDFWKSKEDVIKNWAIDATFEPEIAEEDRCKRIKGWNKAVRYAYGWAKEE